MFALLLAAIVLSGGLSFYNEHKRMQHTISSELESRFEMASTLYKGRIEAMEIIAKVVDERNQVIAGFMDYDRIDPITSILRTIVNAYNLDMAFLFNEEGSLLSASGTGTQTPTPEIYTTLVAGRKQPGVETDKIHPAIVSAQLPLHVLSPDTEYLAIKTIKHVIHDTGDIQGYVVLVKLINQQHELVKEMARAAGAEVVFHDAYHNTVLTSFSDPSLMIPHPQTRSFHFREGRYAVKIENLQNARQEFVGELILAMNEQPFFQKRMAALLAVLPAFVASLIILLILVIFLKTHVFDKISQLITALHAVSAGHLSVRLHFPQQTGAEKSLTELERMGRDFNYMMDRLEQTQTSMLEAQKKVTAMNAELEDRVRERAAELLENKEKLLAEMKAHNEEQEARRCLERQLVQSQKMEAIGTLAGGIAHDFNNILSAIFGYSELSLRCSDVTTLHANLAKILGAAKRASELVRQILTFSRQRETEPKPVELRLIAKETLKLVKASFPSNIEIRSNLASEALVLADPVQMHQVLMNLLTNAGYAMRETGGILEVSLISVELNQHFAARYPDFRPGSYVQLIVSDTGHGMSNEIRERVFEPFFTTKREGEGTGMGLAVVHGIVCRCGGMITVSSEIGKGTTFTVYLPVTRKTVIGETIIPPEIPVGHGHILVVDDEPDLLDINKEMLVALGYTVTTATNGEEALTLFKAAPDTYSLLLTDMTMPHMTGDRLTEEVLSLRPGFPVVICTGFSERLTDTKISALGNPHIIMKPVILRTLALALHEAISKRDLPREHKGWQVASDMEYAQTQ